MLLKIQILLASLKPRRPFFSNHPSPPFLLLLLFVPWLSSCLTLDHLRAALDGKDLITLKTFGVSSLNLKELKTIKLSGFSIADYEHPLVQKHIKLYMHSKKAPLLKIMARGRRYLPLIKQIFVEEGIPLDLAYLPMIESSFHPKAYSYRGAAGLWQFMYHTGLMYQLRANYWVDDRLDLYRSTRAAAYHLKYLYKRLDNWLLVLAAYNAGLGKISRAIKRYDSKDFFTLIQHSYLKPETKNYVPKFIAASLIIKNPQKYGFPPLLYPPPPQLAAIQVKDATEVRLLAEAAQLSLADFKWFNPALKRWATPPSTKYPIYLPEEKLPSFKQRLAAIPPEKRVTFRRYFVKIGDNLTTIAKKFNLPLNPIAKLNKFSSLDEVRAGKQLFIPIQGLDRAKQLDSSLAKAARQNKVSTAFEYVFLHLVRKTDSLYRVAKEYGVGLQALMRWNKLRHPGLRPGRLLVIKLPKKSVAAEASRR